MIKKFIPLFLILGVPLFSQESLWDYHPIHGGAQMIQIGPASVNGGDPNGHVSFLKGSVFTSMLLPISQRSFFIPRLEFNTVRFNWNENPRFAQTYFCYLQFAITFYSFAFDNWRWIVRADYNVETRHLSHIGQYSYYSGLIWGARQFFDNWHFHFGTVGFIGLETTTFYPILGIDYAPCKEWLIQLIFPITYSIDYKLTDKWTLALKGRPLKERLRTGAHEPQPRSIFNYTSTGLEMNLKYEYPLRFTFEGYGGYNFGGRMYVKNAGGHHGIYRKFGGAPYGGIAVDYGF